MKIPDKILIASLEFDSEVRRLNRIKHLPGKMMPGCHRVPDFGFHSLKRQCTRNQANRTITQEANKHLMEAMAARVKAQPQKTKLRKQLCEHPFGTIKRALGYDHFLLKGLAKVRCEWSLITLCYNLKRVLNLVSFEKLMATASVTAPLIQLHPFLQPPENSDPQKIPSPSASSHQSRRKSSHSLAKELIAMKGV